MNPNYKYRENMSREEEEVLEEFLAGKERWNAYVKKNNDMDVDFSNVDFSEHRKIGEIFNFSGYQFPKKGIVDFSRSYFGDGGVNFTYANFGQRVSFKNAKFGKGDVDFSRFCRKKPKATIIRFNLIPKRFTCSAKNGGIF